ncbi:putative receptor-like protein kinase At4g00960 [Brachypodium distachyon]|uniref:putative receptor-like protein kinase At4g00960 n=1 Tax=Brachypodium distachyon TaxID=15368 RepID=UPI0001D43BF7|nr:putative receptor-like protein kinase At4g00960 [Brachypodium distachyon]XP_024319062.1 putative receptor-like protein kinase At4g00960 [Brachypodium distachyon]XP_024319063.1 putative receptor-like protein kinase At4g00960 [Brachypodium distachyon]XP_024319064.1 putative receptor-like protein kinase At4g00960 [Brachypodium distachyon]XP_024319065.1 putative receptor-like protein kinase At4g00960 [Brachypodium distachyon]XP_024319066.1 putative receptor-like protein kinase At4g00960 [Brachy|eukprot:XP_024319061.1 putative receptor-like protein kinase At4g00960 [Brachypodium distachyon]
MDVSVNSMGKISELALKINVAVGTVKQNKDVCMQIGTSVDRLRVILSLLEATETTKHPNMTAPVKDLEGIMARALKLLMDCQENQFSSHLFRAGSLCTELSQVNQEIKEHMNIANVASGVQIAQNSIMLKNAQYMQHGDHPWPQKDVHLALPKDAAEVGSSHNSHSNNETRSEVDGDRKNDPAGSEHFLKESADLKRFEFSEMEAATNNFSPENMIGRGGSAIVYKGVLPDGFVVAIKRFRGSRSSQGDIEHYVNVFLVLPRHENVVRLIGYCQETTYKMMPYDGRQVSAEITNMMVVEEYMPNGTLSETIDGRSPQLHWSSIFRIIRGIAHGLAHLHSNHIIHLDLKPENILLDSNINPKICDFEVSKMLDQEVTEIVTGEFTGTLGYIAPEYIADGIISVKNDVYSFGLLLLCTIRGTNRSGLRQHSVEWAWDVRESQEMGILFDSSLCDDSQLKEIERSIDIGLLCTQDNPTARPTMPDVLEMLIIRKKLPSPTKPGFIKNRVKLIKEIVL